MGVTDGRARVAGHFGEWLQGRLGPDGPVALVTLPCPALAVTVAAEASDRFDLDVPAETLFTRPRLQAFLAALDRTGPLRISGAADMPPGGGAGASTAALVALAHALGVRDPDRVARACLQAEGASDPLMLAEPGRILWAPREGRVIDRIDPPPAMELVGGFLDYREDTDARDQRFPDISDLVDAWRGAARRADAAACARLATASADRTTGLRGPADDPASECARDLGALGYVRAHTGSARGLLFPVGAVPDHAEAVLREAGLSGLLRFRTGAAS